ncbi:TetR/AcrR family transcriptional regulator [Pseudovibrio exalbescens]|uniref:TetR/AcrR family transcriptional regulator n=1 Tax=Pseudovibrio exalbescens TaxID=197461 RepID=UPI0023666AF6|nr:TetR/AcrR family transcriptional regulator [Pseudovibrio exalbescens]MDD7910172.1 TetR/AcrR family transcriptional regulator [Pseudovibrio exalbescens]
MAKTEKTTVERIVEAAESRIRTAGFHGFSFRDVAGDVGIKSASVHHHFPTKDALGVAVARSYTDRFLRALGDPGDESRGPEALLAAYAGLFRRALMVEGKMCLCGVLAAESAGLSAPVQLAARDFFQRNLAWLKGVHSRQFPGAAEDAIEAEALRTIALMEGAILTARALDDVGVFDVLTQKGSLGGLAVLQKV